MMGSTLCSALIYICLIYFLLNVVSELNFYRCMCTGKLDC